MCIAGAAAPTRHAVFLDRDGVINDIVVRNGKPHPPPSAEELVILPGVPEALVALRRAGFLTVVVTNQPDVATGIQERSVVDTMHRRLLEELALDAIQVCFHLDADGCACRKPEPGMILEAALEYGIALDRSWLIGDRRRDIEAGERAGCRTFWIDRGYRESAPKAPDFVVSSLPEATRIILREFEGSARESTATAAPSGERT